MSNNLLMAWLDAKQKLNDAKQAEADLRASIMEKYHDPSIEAGTENTPVNGGKLKIVNAIDYKFIDPKNPGPRNPQKDLRRSAMEALNELVGVLGESGPFIADRLVKWVPELSVKEYKLLPHAAKKIIDRVIETKAQSPQVSWEKDADT